ncbi:PQQ-dependent sugar dehydrogenase [Pengzhenrongella frigida]|uniref:PQQ-dependent sugar dehydrogenase n=2 Tax=Pengzhenrongella frigida TaxID=1259133 RepID=A0A4Q5MXP1_9MICO|nr:PQQ-dependent sugar dehydrogenase [Cellulomonas sp. HLT2-17]
MVGGAAGGDAPGGRADRPGAVRAGGAGRRPWRAAGFGAVVAGCVALAGCVGTGEAPRAGTTAGSQDSPTATPASPAAPTATAAPTPPAVVEIPTVDVTSATDVATGLDAPWGLAFRPDGAALVTLRDEARVVVVGPAGDVTRVDGPGAADLAATTMPDGEAGLLGIAIAPAGGPHAGEVYLYRTVADGNEVVRATLAGDTLGALQPVLDGIPKAANHDGGRLAFGPDGFLYVTTGDAATPANAQDPANLGGKILRITADGDPAPGNPAPGSPVWTLGHRNVQGLGWAPDGRMFAAEFGQNTFDELNAIVPGANYGWPVVEGTGGTDRGFTDPLITWPTSDASPSGLAVTSEGVYLAGLRGARLWRAPLTADGVGRPQALLAGELGRLRAVVVAPDGSLWVMTNNTDGRGDPRPGDDRIVRVTVG